jgi:hypothetical protein
LDNISYFAMGDRDCELFLDEFSNKIGTLAPDSSGTTFNAACPSFSTCRNSSCSDSS